MTTFHLPVELWRAVFEQLVDDSLALARVCLASKSFLSIAQPILYRQLSLGVGIDDLLETHVLCRRHLDSFRANPRLGSLVQSLRFFDNYLSGGRYLEVRLSEAVGQLFELLPSLDIILLERVSQWRDIDIAVARYQDNFNPPRTFVAIRRRPIVFRLELPDDILYVTSCHGAYEGCTYRNTNYHQTEGLVPATFLSKSLQTLRTLSIPLVEGLDLSPFRILESLCFELSIKRPTHVIPTVVQVVPAVETLRSLRLRGFFSDKEVSELITQGRIIDCLGPNVVSVSFEWQLLCSELISLAQSIPSTSSAKRPTSLKRFTCLPVEIDRSARICSDDEIEEYEKERSIIAVDEFRKRGIELRFDATRVFE